MKLIGVVVLGSASLVCAAEPPSEQGQNASLSGAPHSVAVVGAGAPIQSGACISVEQRAAVRSLVDRFLIDNPWHAPQLRATMPYEFFPQGGNLYGDIYPNNYVDMDPTGGILDWDCTDHTYNGHLGHDIGLRSFDEQAIGVPVYAALDGVVAARDDGHPDMNTVWAGQPANFVVLTHPNGHVTYYWLLRNGSVAVNLGESVVAGQELGMTASSGISTGPHLHFETQDSGFAVEPSTGVCNPGASIWTNQTPIRRDTYLDEFGVSRTSLSGQPGPPFGFPRSSHVTFSDTLVYYWMLGHNLPAGSTARWVFIRPNGTVSFDSGNNPISFSTQDYRAWWAWWSWNIPEMRSISGEWNIELYLNGVLEADVPVTVMPTFNPSFNRAPLGVTGAFDPAVPEEDDVIFYRIDPDLILDDPDLDIVSYRYVWRVNGSVVRDSVLACHADALAHDQYGPGDTVSVEVTPSDGSLDGPVLSDLVVIAGGCAADVTTQGAGAGDPGFGVPDGLVTNADIQFYVNLFVVMDLGADLTTAGAGAGDPGFGVPDGQVTNADIQFYVNLFVAGCP